MSTPENYLVTPEHKLVYQRLVKIAQKHGKPIGYRDIFNIVEAERGSYGPNPVFRMLDDINHQTHLSQKPMLTALVVNKKDNMPGSGFFELALRFGKLPASASKQEKREFWEEELARVYAAEW